MGGTWRGRAVSGDRVALGTGSCFGGTITGMFSDIHLDITTTTTTTTTTTSTSTSTGTTTTTTATTAT